MKIEHIGLWVEDIEEMKVFYEKYFGAKSNDSYHNPVKKFTSYFLTFGNGCRLEIMQRPDISSASRKGETFGYAHLAVSLETKEAVDTLTEKLREDGYQVLDGPRTTGDGYYESVILDPEGNRIEITI